MMETLQELRAQRREIDKKIKMLQNNVIINGTTMFERHHYGTGLVTWRVRIKTHSKTYGKDVSKWQQVVENVNRDGAIERLNSIITDLCNLRERIKESEI